MSVGAARYVLDACRLTPDRVRELTGGPVMELIAYHERANEELRIAQAGAGCAKAHQMERQRGDHQRWIVFLRTLLPAAGKGGR